MMTAELEEQMVAMIRAGKAVTQIKTRLKRSPRTIKRIAKKHGLVIREGMAGRPPRNKKRTPEIEQKIREMCAEKKRLAEISEEVGLNLTTIRTFCKAEGIPYVMDTATASRRRNLARKVERVTMVRSVAEEIGLQKRSNQRFWRLW